MRSFSARFALGLAGLFLLAAGASLATMVPAQASTCNLSFSPTTGGTITDCSEIVTFTGTSVNNLTFTVSTPANGSAYSGTFGYGAYNVSGYALIGVVNNSNVTIPDLYVGGGLTQNVFALQSLENLCAGTFTPGLGTSCSATVNGIITQLVGSNLSVLTNTGIFIAACSGGQTNNCGDVNFITGASPLGLAPGETAIFALTDATCLAQPNNPGPTVSNGCLSPSGLTQVPEPGSLAVFGTGLLGLVVYRRRRRAPTDSATPATAS